MTGYRIVRWQERFENNRTKELKKMSWVPVSNQLDDDGYTELVDHPNGAAHYGAWCAMVQVASKCAPRGVLARDNRQPHTTASLARITRIPEALFTEAIARLLAIGWLENCEIPQEAAPAPQRPAPVPQEDAATPHPDAELDAGLLPEGRGPRPEAAAAMPAPYRLTFDPPAGGLHLERFRSFWTRCKSGEAQELIFQKGREELRLVACKAGGS